MAATRWVRNRAGTVVHRAECSLIKGKGIQWDWAEPHKTGGALAAALVHAPWVKPCGGCNPYEDDPMMVSVRLDLLMEALAVLDEALDTLDNISDDHKLDDPKLTEKIEDWYEFARKSFDTPNVIQRLRAAMEG